MTWTRRWLWLVVLFLLMGLTEAHERRVEFRPCGFKAGPRPDQDEALTAPSPNRTRYSVLPSAVILIIGIRQPEGALKCSMLHLSGGEIIFVIGRYETVRDRLYVPWEHPDGIR